MLLLHAGAGGVAQGAVRFARHRARPRPADPHGLRLRPARRRAGGQAAPLRTAATEAFLPGPQLHSIEGSWVPAGQARDRPAPAGSFYGECLWENSWEDEADVASLRLRRRARLLDADRLRLRLHAAPSWAGRSSSRNSSAAGWATPAAASSASRPNSGTTRRRTCASSGPQAIGAAADRAFRPQVACSCARRRRQGQAAGRHGRHARPASSPRFDLLRRAARERRSRCCCWAKPASARRCSRARCTTPARARRPVHRGELRRHPGRRCSRPSSSASSAAPTPAPTAARAGRFERADGGTLFLDEIGDLPLPLQAKLLRALQERRDRARSARRSTRKVDVRIVAATNATCAALVERGALPRRPVLPAQRASRSRIPPLRERKRRHPAAGRSASLEKIGRARREPREPHRQGDARADERSPGRATSASCRTCSSAASSWPRAARASR